jgi:hypothetical protein
VNHPSFGPVDTVPPEVLCISSLNPSIRRWALKYGTFGIGYKTTNHCRLIANMDGNIFKFITKAIDSIYVGDSLHNHCFQKFQLEPGLDLL